MNVLFWVPYPTEGASNRYRVEQYLPYLKEAGIKYSLHPFWSNSAFRILYKQGFYFKKTYFFLRGTFLRILDLLQIFRYDIVFIHREAYPFGRTFEAILVLLKKPFIFDFDDAIFLPFPYKLNNFIDKFKSHYKFVTIIKQSNHVIVGNQYLANFVLKYNKQGTVIPTSIDTNRYRFDGCKNSDRVVIGWIGGIFTLNFVNMLEGAFFQLSKRYPNVIFKIVGGDFSIAGLPNIISKPWALDEEIEDLKTFDIGIMPMPDNEWTKGKCGFKAILYMSMGMPCVCSPVGVNTEIIRDGLNGFLAETEEEWIRKLSLLIEDPLLRQKIGLEGRMTVEERYSLKVNAPKFLEIIEKVYNRNNKS